MFNACLEILQFQHRKEKKRCSIDYSLISESLDTVGIMCPSYNTKSFLMVHASMWNNACRFYINIQSTQTHFVIGAPPTHFKMVVAHKILNQDFLVIKTITVIWL